MPAPEQGYDPRAGTGFVSVLGKDSFHDTALNSERAFLATDWGRRSVAFTGHGLPLQADVAVRDMMADQQNQYLPRRNELVDLLGIDVDWRMHQLSDGQRRRVQIMLQLLRPVAVLLLDEITTDLDLITRQDFLNYLRDCNTTIVYATHIFDGLDGWATHIAYMDGGRLSKFGRVEEFTDLQQRVKEGTVAPLLRTIESWLRAARDSKRKSGVKLTEEASMQVDELRGVNGNGYLSGRFNQGYG